MKNILTLLLSCISFYGFSQENNDRIIYLDSNYVRVDQGNHSYYQIVKDFHLNKKFYIVEEFYKSGHLKMGAVSSDKFNFKFEGVVVNFFENDTIQSKTLYSDGKPNGSSFSWYDNGKKRMEGEYVIDKFSASKAQVLKIYQFWDENGVQKVTDGNGIQNVNSPNFSASGEIKDGLRNGNWTGTDKTYKLSFSDIYENGKFISGVSKDDQSVERTYTQINELPSPRKGFEHFYNFVGRKLNIGRNTNVSGKIMLSFIVDKNGAIDKIEVLRGMNIKLDREAIRVLKLYADWTPGNYRGKPIDVSYKLPISILPN